MRRKALNVDIYKEFTKSLSRFLSIAVMIALGTFIFVGLFVTGPTMRNTILTYVDAQHLEDMMVTSPLGLELEDQAILASLPGVEILDYSYRTDLMIQNADDVVRAESLGELPGYEVVGGRLPEGSDEIALDGLMMEKGYKIGDAITFVRDKVRDKYELKCYEYTIVGFVNSPEYLMPTDKGAASIGDGEVDFFGVILKENFDLENISLARLTFRDVQGLDAYSNDYKDRMKAHVEALEDAFASRPEIRLEKYHQEGAEEITEAEGEIAEAETELFDAQKKLADARVELDQAYIDYREGKATFDREIADAQKKIDDGQQELWDAKVELDDGYAKLADGERKLADSKVEFADAEATLTDAGVKLADGEQQLNDAQEKIDDGREELEEKKDQVYDGLRQVDDGLEQIAAGLESLTAGLAQIDAALPQIDGGLQQTEGGLTAIGTQMDATEPKDETNSEYIALMQQKAELEATKAGLEAQKAELLGQKEALGAQLAGLQAQQEALFAKRQEIAEAVPLLVEGEEKLDDGQKKLDKEWANFYEKKAEYEDGLKELEEGRVKIADAEKELADARAKLADGQAKYNDGAAKLEEARATLADEKAKGEQELKDAYKKILDGEADYQKGLREFKAELPGAREDIAEGKAEIVEAKGDLARLKVPDYTIRDRYKEPGFFQFIENSEGMDMLSKIFPIFFFMIALLVSLTTMTRMVDEQRLQIGILKALGYSDWNIVKKYLAYGSFASLIGSAIGIVGGHRLLMPTVFEAYSSNFLFKEALPMLPQAFSVIAVLISLLCTGFAALLTTRSSLRDNVATLIRPKAPKTGNRIFLERLTPVWNRLSFNYKVTARNLFRYKKRMTMTILGVAGCTALIFMGFGLRDSVGGILVKQYGDIFRYDTVVIYDDDAAQEDLQSFHDMLGSDARISGIFPARFEQGIIQVPGKLDQTLNVIVPEDEAAFRTINVLKDRDTQEALELNGAIITEKIAHLLNLKAGDTIEFKDDDGTLKTIQIAGVTENYTGHYLYLPADYYEEIFAKPLRANSNFILLHDHSSENTNQFSRNMLDQDVVMTTVNSNVAGETIKELLGSLNTVVGIILLISSLLAIVVLYNLTNINVSERIRELSTIMVLGFYPEEVTAYVYRETMFLTFIGIFVGYFFGRGLHSFIITMMAPSNVLMDPTVYLSSYVLSTVFTLAFSLAVMLIMHRKLGGVDMVEALKAVE